MLFLQGVSYAHPNRDLLFTDINLVINRHDKVALIGNNGSGKSTLLNILAENLHPLAGFIKADLKPYYIPQIFGQFNDHSIARALQAEVKLKALKEILNGHVTDANLALLGDDWNIEERCNEALTYWKLEGLNLTKKMETLSGGEKTKVFLAGIMINQPQVVLLDEPSNHLDTNGRNILYNYIRSTTNTLVVVSHDRTLLNLLNTVYELGKNGITAYGGNYDFYTEQKKIESDAFSQDLKNKEKALRKAKETEQESLERKQKLDARGKKKQEKSGLPTISMNTFKNKAEKSTARIRGAHADKVETISGELNQLRKSFQGISQIKMDIDNSALHKGKILFTAKDINFGYDEQLLWRQPITLQITSGERIAIKGLNGSGKTTIIKMILGELQPQTGTIERANADAIYIDQDYSLIVNHITVYQQAQQFNSGGLQEHEIKIRLTRFLFPASYWDKPCNSLSGGEKMRLMLCCLTIANHAPDIIILDEPTNNLDIQNIEILTAAINEYEGTLIVVSHDEYFLKQINVMQTINLE